MTITNDYFQQLQTAEFSFDSPIQLLLKDGRILYVEKIIRILPKKRLVAFATLDDKPVVTKLFFNKNNAQNHLARDLVGINILQERKIPTPTLYYQGLSKDECVQVLIFERIFAAESLQEIWQNKKNTPEILATLKFMITELATQHVLGVLQRDLHFNNFLLTDKKVYTLDGAAIKLFPYLLAKKPSMRNLALFLSQLGVGMESYQEKLFKYYAKARGWLLKKEDREELFLAIKKWRDLRWQRFSKKIFRSSSRFACIRTKHILAMYDRDYISPALSQFLQDPDQVFNDANAIILKAGRSATVIKLILGQHQLVIKRYNIKNSWHYLRRCMRKTRAATCWRLAHKLLLFGVLTAKPVAFIEKKFMGLNGQSYYVTEYIAGGHLGDYFQQHLAEQAKSAIMLKQVTNLLRNLFKLNITHGDLKATNILFDQQDNPLLIDLDGAVEHSSLSSLRAAWRKEIKRFMANFADQPAIYEQFKQML